MWTRKGGRLTRSRELQPAQISKPRRRPASRCRSIRIPDLTLTLAFEFLEDREVGTCTGVNKRFKFLAYTASCWQHVDIMKVDEKYYLEYISFIGRLRPRIKSLRLLISDSEIYILEWLLKCCDTFSLPRASITLRFETVLTRKSNILGQLDMFVDLSSVAELRRIQLESSEASIRVRTYLLNSCEVELSTFGSIFGCGLELLITMCPNIVDLSCKRTGYERNGFRFDQLKCLQKLRLHTLDISCHADSSCLDFLVYCAQLEHLKISCATSYNSTFLSLKAPKLRTIDFTGMPKAQWLSSIDCPNLEMIKISMRGLYGSGFLLRSNVSTPREYGYIRPEVLKLLPLDDIIHRMIFPLDDDTRMSPVAMSPVVVRSVSPRFCISYEAVCWY